MVLPHTVVVLVVLKVLRFLKVVMVVKVMMVVDEEVLLLLLLRMEAAVAGSPPGRSGAHVQGPGNDVVGRDEIERRLAHPDVLAALLLDQVGRRPAGRRGGGGLVEAKVPGQTGAS